LQTISIPYQRSSEDQLYLRELRRIYSAAIRTAYANAVVADCSKLKQKDFAESALELLGEDRFVQMLTGRARLAGIQVIEVWGGYSSTIGNITFDAPDACATT
jgi:ABC-type uncharacterized transport system involved in gliding motility auxiliary subunit